MNLNTNLDSSTGNVFGTTNVDTTPTQTPLGLRQGPVDSTGAADSPLPPTQNGAQNPVLPRPSAPPMTPEQAINGMPDESVLAAQLEQGLGEELEAFVNSGKITSKNKNLIMTLYKTGKEKDIPPELKGTFDSALKNATTELKQQYPKLSNPPPRNTEKNIEDLTQKSQQELRNLLREVGLTNPDGTLNATGKEIEFQIMTNTAPTTGLAGQIVQDLNGRLENLFGTSKIDIGADQFIAQTNFTFQEAVLKQSSGLSAADQKTFEYLFYHPDPQHPLQAKVDAAKITAFAEMREKTGAPADFKTEISTVAYDAKLNGTFYNTLDQSISKDPRVKTSGDREAVTAYLKAKQEGKADSFSPGNNTSLTLAQIINIATAANVTAMNAVINTFGVPATWAPDPTKALSNYVGGPGLAMIRNLTDITDILNNFINDPSISPENKAVYANILAQVSAALQDLNQLMYVMQQQDIEGSRKGSQAHLAMLNAKKDILKVKEAQAEKLRGEQIKQDADVDAQNKQDYTMSIVGPILMFLSSVAAILITILTLGIGTSLAVVIVVCVVIALLTYIPSGQVDARGKSMGLMAAGMQELNKALDSLDNPALADFIRFTVVVVVVAVAACAGNPMASMMMAGFIIASSGFIDKMVTDAFNSTEDGRQYLKDHPYAAAIIAAVITVVVLIGAGASSAKQVASTAATATTSATRAAGTASNFTKVIDKLKSWKDSVNNVAKNIRENKPEVVTGLTVGSQSIEATTRVGTGISQSTISFAMSASEKRIAEALKDLGQTEGAIELIQSIIDLLTKFLEKITENGDDLTQFQGTITQSINKLFQGSSEATSNLYNSA